MTEEAPITSKEDYQFPRIFFKKLEDYEEDDQRYDNARRDLYHRLAREEGIPMGRVEEINRFLEKGKVGLAEDITNEVLDYDNGGLK